MFIPVAITVAIAALAAAQHQHHPAGSEKLGTVKFSTSCSEAAQPAFGRAMALLHSFEFAPAIESFSAASAADPTCAIAHWGVALSRWGNPFAAGIKPPAALQAGRTAIEKAKAAGAKTDRERAFIDAAGQLFADFETRDQRTRVLAYRDAMQQVAAGNPKDPEASAFYALALASSQDPADMTYSSLLAAGKILEQLAPTQPDHPGFVHYIIHAYDAPPLASRALDSARRYAKIAPSAPHALHMPSHTFTRLGYWQDSIETNIASAEAARRVKVPGEELHAMDYQAYAYLQLAQDASTKKVVDALGDVRARLTGPGAMVGAAPPLAAAFASAAIPARYALERGAWAEAARLEPLSSTFPQAEAITWFGKAIGAARMEQKDLAGARTAIANLEQLQAKLASAKEAYWAELVRIQHLGASAWLAFADGRKDEALSLMREAADREDKVEKNAVTPGPIAPAREQLGEMLLVFKQPAPALEAFEITLEEGAEPVSRACGRHRSRAPGRLERGQQGAGLQEQVCRPLPRVDLEGGWSTTAGTCGREVWRQTVRARGEVVTTSSAKRLMLAGCCLLLAGVSPRAQGGPAEQGVQRLLDSAQYKKASAFVEGDYDRFVNELIALNEIPAPPFKEQPRAKGYVEMLRKEGLSDVELDAEGNAIGVRRGRGPAGGPMVAIVAHIDTVFPEGTDVTVTRKGTRLNAPGIGDNTRGIALMLAVVRAINAGAFQTASDILFVGNVGEEGEGDLRGVKFLMRKGKYKDRITQFIAIDGQDPANITRGGVGSLRYRVTFKGPGGHSYGAFGLVNPAFAMGNAIAKFSRLQVPSQPKTTFNVGVVSGGTSVNSIPARVQMVVDLRSESCAELQKVRDAFLAVVKEAVEEENMARSIREGSIAADPALIGDRPCGETALTSPIVQTATAVVKAFGLAPSYGISSTDSNVPMNLGIPAITIGRGGPGGRAHSPDEWTDVEKKESVEAIKVAMTIILAVAGVS